MCYACRHRLSYPIVKGCYANGFQVIVSYVFTASFGRILSLVTVVQRKRLVKLVEWSNKYDTSQQTHTNDVLEYIIAVDNLVDSTDTEIPKFYVEK